LRDEVERFGFLQLHDYLLAVGLFHWLRESEALHVLHLVLLEEEVGRDLDLAVLFLAHFRSVWWPVE